MKRQRWVTTLLRFRHGSGHDRQLPTSRWGPRSERRRTDRWPTRSYCELGTGRSRHDHRAANDFVPGPRRY